MSSQLEQLATFLHSLFCKTEHLMVMEEYYNRPDLCRFYLERSIASSWELPDHSVWKEEAQRFIEELNVETPGEALSILNKLLSVRKALEEIIAEHPEAMTVFLKLQP